MKKNKILYEVKPISNKESTRCRIKQKAAEEWCELHNYTFKYIDESYLSIRKQKIKTMTSNDKILKAITRLP